MFYKKRDKKAEPALGAASENAVAAVNENEIATGENILILRLLRRKAAGKKRFEFLRQSPVRFAVCFGQRFLFRPFLWTCSLSGSNLCSLRVRFSPYFRLLQP